MNKYESKQFYSDILVLLLPIVFQNLINVGVTMTDVVMLGNVNETSLAACSLAGQIQFIMMLVFSGLTAGASVLTAQYWGKKDTRTIEKVMAITMRFSLCIGLFFALLAIFTPEMLIRIYSPENIIIREGSQYLRIVGLSYLFMSVTNIYLYIMRSVEQVLVATIIYSISLLFNIGADWILIFGLFGLSPMGIRGAAMGTLLSRLLELILVFIYARFFNHVIHFRLSDMILSSPLLLKDFLKYSTPTVLNEIVCGVGLSANAAILGHLGSAAVAANSVAQMCRQLATIVAFGIANVAGVMIGKKIGASEYRLTREYARKFIKLSLLTGGAAAFILVLIRPVIVHSMKLSSLAGHYLSFMFFVVAYFSIAKSFNSTMVSTFRAGGDTKTGLVMDITMMWGGSILLGFLAAFVFRLDVRIVYVFLLSDEILKVPISVWRYRSGKWLNNVTR